MVRWPTETFLERPVPLMFGRPGPELISSAATVWIGIPLAAQDFDGSQVDVTQYAGSLALEADGQEPDPGDYVAGAWHQRNNDVGELVWYLDVLAGPTGTTPWPVPSGDVAVWWQLAAFPETPTGRAPGRIVIYAGN